VESEAGPNPAPRPVSVGVVGASARAAAHSLLRAGYAPWAGDLFADRDLRLVAPSARCPLDQYPTALPSLADRFPPGPVMYTGGLENHPEVVAGLARRRLVLGNGPDVLAKARDPAFLSGPAAQGVAVPDTWAGPRPAPASARVLSKPIASSGGLGVRLAEPGEVAGPGRYHQEFIDGPPMSAQFVTIAGVTTLHGVTDQLVGEPWLHARPFGYGGNIGPAAVSGELRAVLSGLGGWYGRAAGLRGVWGLDFVLRDGHPYPVEINPRYTAAMEVLEHATGRPVLQNPTPPPVPLPRGGGGRGVGSCVGKAVYYAPCPITFPPDGPWDDDLGPPFDPWRVPGYADIPDPGEAIEPGRPVLTFFAAGSTTADCRERLKERAAELDRLFGWEAPT
jgi:predicted ATP-grasp superfamily ATP-dependent carboligase